MKSSRSAPVLIVGGGFAGTMTAAQLARRGIDCLLFEATDRSGLGTAYSTSDPAHLLNVRVRNMSAWPDDPEDFAAAASDTGVGPDGFAQRRHFGVYLRAILDSAIATGRTTLIGDRAVAARPSDGGWTLATGSGKEFHGSALVLAIGNAPPEIPVGDPPGGKRFIANPWGEEARSAVASAVAEQADVLIIGTGLTMVDLVLSLQSSGHEGRIVAISRRGLAPRGHVATPDDVPDGSGAPVGNLLSLWRWLRARAEQWGWREAIDSLRPRSHELWMGLPIEDRRRFLRHARPWWDVHRHRIAPQVADQLERLQSAGRLEIMAGRIAQIRQAGQAVEVAVRRRGTGLTGTVSAGYVFNCTGPLGAIERTGDPLLRSMLEKGLAEPDALGVGLDVDSRSRLKGVQRAWALGSLTKGRYWEIIAVPDIREQAALVAEDIAMEMEA